MKRFAVILIAFVLLSCNNQSACNCDALNKQIDLLTKEANLNEQTVKSLNEELQGYKYSPSKLIAEAEDFFKGKKKKELANAHSIAIKYHPEASETKRISDLVERLNKIEQDSIAKAEAERLLAVTKLKKRHDDVDGTTWYSQSYYTHYNNRNLFSIYIGQKGASVWLRLKMSYEGDSWIFFENAYLSYDGNTITIPFNEYDDKESDNSGGGVWEWIDVNVTDDILLFLRKFVEAKEPKMRLSGKYTRTRTLGKNEIKGLKDILLAYDVLTTKK